MTNTMHEDFSYSGANLGMISFPLGGIGTGSVGLSGRGGLVDWEIFNRPNIGWYTPKTFPIVWVKEKGSEPICRVLQAPPLPPYQGGGGGDPCACGEGLPHMDSCTFRGEYPFAWIDFKSRKLPVRISLEAFNPFIPSDPDNSGFPIAVMKYCVFNPGKKPVDLTLAWSVLNMVGAIGVAERDPGSKSLQFGFGRNVNRLVRQHGLQGLEYVSEKYSPDHPRFGSMAVLTPDPRVTILKTWSREAWFTSMHDFWDTFSSTGVFPDRECEPTADGQTDAGAVGIRCKLKPGESRILTFYITWYFPNFEKYWDSCCDSCQKPVWKNYYASQFTDAVDVAVQFHKNEKKLYQETKQFHQALFASNLPSAILDAVSSQMSILKTTTCLRLTDGTFYAFEGCAPHSGCCEGSCTHVWNYQQALAFLFPSLERSMRQADFQQNLREDGGMCFRLQLPLGSKPNDFHACVDGQLGGILKTYRDWKISGDDNWLKKIGKEVLRSLEYAFVQWDPNRDGVIDGIQHNTYDIEFQGPNPLSAFFYLNALEAGAQIADSLGDVQKAIEYRQIADQGREWVESNLFNGEYFVQLYDPDKVQAYQFGKGCLSDQLLGQQMASLTGLKHCLDRKKIRKTLQSIFHYNWRKQLTDHPNCQRVYAMGDESGLLMCTWPHGGRPRVPVVYCDEVWTGIEYQVAAHLIMEGLVREGLTIVQGARSRHDGIRRNPWDEFECGHHYARAMASYALLPAAQGFKFDKGTGLIGFKPQITPANHRSFWALDGCWGQVHHFQNRQLILSLDWGQLDIKQVYLPLIGKNCKVNVSWRGKTFESMIDQTGMLTFDKPIRMKKSDTLKIAK